MALSAFGPAQRRVLWYPVGAVSAVAPVAVVVSALVAGPAAAAAAAGGVVVSLAFFAVSVLVVLIVDEVAPKALLGAAVGSYAVKVALLVPVLALAYSPVTRCFAWTVLACAVAWQVGHVTGLVRARILYLEPIPPTPPERQDEAAHQPDPSPAGLIGSAS